MTYNDTEILIQKYLNGETTAEEERLLALEVSREDAPEDWKIIAGMLGELTIDEALYDKMMDELRQQSRIMKLWPWVAAACIAALLIIFLGPPKDNMPNQPQTAESAIDQGKNDVHINPVGHELALQEDKAESQKSVVEVMTAMPHSTLSENVGQKEEKSQDTENMPQPTRMKKHHVSVSQGIAKASQAIATGQIARPEDSVRVLTKVEEDDIVPYEDSQTQFFEQARVLRERGNRVIQRVSMNSLPPNINPIKNL